MLPWQITTLRIQPYLQEKIKSDQIRLELYANRPTVVILSIFGRFIDTGSRSSKVGNTERQGYETESTIALVC